ncbi:hypothetical protein GIB67_018738 [Kingdonia uniflora]|uniref:Uncharacterized protein n=1 Tax=Kingdonia uniflora TaxID=39325 RepID=A0A7J7LSW9_9MAGN|nr:hypothetical protein GIB67_018738 [Kingdonia uniflora]
MDLDTLLRNSQVEIRERETEITALKQQLEDGYGRKAEKSKIVELEAKLSPKNEEIEILKHSQMELRTRVYSVHKQKDQVDENFVIASRKSAITSKCLDDVRNDLLVLTCSLDTHIYDNKMLERNSFELESGKHELELHQSEMEEENAQLSERISELEAQLREVAQLSEQISATHYEREIKASNAILEVSSLHPDKVKLESALQDEQAKVKLFGTKIHNIQLESGNKLQRLITELSASKQNQELLVADHENLQRLLDDVKASE